MTRALLICALVLTGCDATGGREVPFAIRLRGTGGSDFTTSAGWNVKLSEARVVLGPLYLFDGAPATADRRRGLSDALAGLFIRSAWAHAGDSYFAGGLCLGELLDQVALDVLDPAGFHAPGLTGNAGTALSYSIKLDAPRGALANADGPTHGHHAWVKGTATKGALAVPFEGGLDIAEAGRQRFVDGLGTTFQLDTDRTFVLEVKPARWFDSAAFDTLEVTEGQETRVIDDRSLVRASWFVGVRDARAWGSNEE